MKNEINLGSDLIKVVNKTYNYMNNGMPVETFKSKFHMNDSELMGIIELCNLYGKNISLELIDDTMVFKKSLPRKVLKGKFDVSDPKLSHYKVGIVSDLHIGNINNQVHLLNEVYKEAYNRGIDVILFCGDITDGNYPTRPENMREQFLHGFSEQVGYTIDMYPEIEGMKTYYILGNHDVTHYKNGYASVSDVIGRTRKDMIFLGQDFGEFNLGKVKFVLEHPDGGSSMYVSYKLQKRIENIDPNIGTQVLCVGHYHKSYVCNYQNVLGILVPALCGKTQFQQRRGLSNAMGAYFVDLYVDSHGNIQYSNVDEMSFSEKDIWDEAGKDKKKVKKLEIKNSYY